MSLSKIEARSMFFSPDTALAVEPKEKLLQGKIVLVTGASRGIGAEIARTLGREGAIIIGPHRDPGKQRRADSVIAEVQAFGGEMVAPACDITNPDDRQKLFDEVQQKYGRVDILIHNAAGGMERDAEYDYAKKINSDAKLALNTLFLPIMPKGGKIIDITSLWSVKYGRVEQLPSYEPVARTKHLAEIWLKQSVSQFERLGITLGFVCGHMVEDTITVEGFKKKYSEKMEAVSKLAEGGKPSTTVDMAAAVLRLATTDFAQGHIEYVGGKNAGPENWDRSFIRQVLRMYGEDGIYVDNFLLSEDRQSGIGTLTITPEHCRDHFEDYPVLPAKEVMEAAGQTLFLIAVADREDENLRPLFREIGYIPRFNDFILPGDKLSMEGVITKATKYVAWGNVLIKINGEERGEIKDIEVSLVSKRVFPTLVERARKKRK